MTIENVMRRKRLLILAVLAACTILGATGIAFASNPGYGGGNIAGKPWTGRSYLSSYGAGGGGWVYSGNGSTWINDHSNVEQITVDNWGFRYCNSFYVNEGWFAQDTKYWTFMAYAAGSGWANWGICSLFPGADCTFFHSYSAHNLWHSTAHSRDTSRGVQFALCI